MKEPATSGAIEPETKHPTGASRRQVIGAAGVTILAALGRAETAFAVDSLENELTSNDTVEGYFLVMRKQARVFFISSEWLDYFEVPSSMLGNQKDAVIGKITGNGGNDGKKRRVKIDALYSNLTHPGIAENTADLVPPTPPGARTYLAMSISPDVNDDLGN